MGRVATTGAYGEHQIERVDRAEWQTEVTRTGMLMDSRSVSVELAPGAVGRLALFLRRYANAPTPAFPLGVSGG